MKTSDLLKKAQLAREQQHRLKPSLRLGTIEEVRDFIHSKGLVSMLGGNELPSFTGAILGRAWKPSGRGFSGWLDWYSIRLSGHNAGHWISEIPRMKDILGMRIFRGSKTFVSDRLWPTLDPIVKRYGDLAARHRILSQLEWTILEFLEKNGPTRTDRLRTQLKMEGKQFTSRFHRALSQLESFGLIVGYEDPHPERHLHANIWHLWNDRIGSTVKRAAASLSYQEALTSLLEKTIDTCVFAPEKGVEKWFRWNTQLTEIKENLVATGKVARVGPFLVTTRIAGPNSHRPLRAASHAEKAPKLRIPKPTIQLHFSPQTRKTSPNRGNPNSDPL